MASCGRVAYKHINVRNVKNYCTDYGILSPDRLHRPERLRPVQPLDPGQHIPRFRPRDPRRYNSTRYYQLWRLQLAPLLSSFLLWRGDSQWLDRLLIFSIDAVLGGRPVDATAPEWPSVIFIPKVLMRNRRFGQRGARNSVIYVGTLPVAARTFASA